MHCRHLINVIILGRCILFIQYSKAFLLSYSFIHISRCREKDEEIEDLHKKVIALQVKIKDFVQQNSQAEEQVRHIKEKYATELNEKDKVAHALSASETKCRALEEDVKRLESKNEEWEKKIMETKSKMEGLETERDEGNEKMVQSAAEIKKSEEEIEKLRKQVTENENS